MSSAMNFLPKELWIEIFELVNVKDLLSLCEVCKEFNSIINDTKLVENFTLYLTEDERKNINWICGRKYSQIEIIQCGDIDRLMQIFKEFGRNIRKIAFFKLNIEIKTLQDIFIECPKVNNLHFSEINVISPENIQPQLPNYHHLKIYFEDSSPVIFELLKNSSALDVMLDNKCSARHVDFGSFKKFLKNQRELKSLGFLYFSINTNLFTDNELDFVSFRLTSFTLNNVYLGIESVARFQTFMLNHVDALNCLHVQSPFLDVSFFKQFSALKELQISHTNAFFDTYENVEKVTVENVSGNWMEKFPNVKNLTMIFKYGVFLGMYANLVNLLQLEDVKICDSKIPELNIPSVRKLSLKNVVICAKHPFKFEDNQIRELVLDSCSSIEWIPDFLAQESTRLKLLSISNMNINDLILKIIEGFRLKKIKFLRIINC